MRIEGKVAVVTGAASGTYESARSSAERVNAPGKIHVIDSRNASLGQGLLGLLEFLFRIRTGTHVRVVFLGQPPVGFLQLAVR